MIYLFDQPHFLLPLVAPLLHSHRLIDHAVLCPYKISCMLSHARGLRVVLEVGLRWDVALRVHLVHGGCHVLRKLVT